MQTTEIEDRIKIHDLFVRYCSAVDNWDEPALLCCFTEDGVLETPVLGGRFAGRDGQREFVLVGHSRAKGGQMRHFQEVEHLLGLLDHCICDLVIRLNADAAEESREHHFVPRDLARASAHQFVGNDPEERAQLENVPDFAAENGQR